MNKVTHMPVDQKEKPKEKRSDKNTRGSMDEMEALVMIINENIGLKARIMEKIRAVREEKSKRDARTQKKSEEAT